MITNNNITVINTKDSEEEFHHLCYDFVMESISSTKPSGPDGGDGEQKMNEFLQKIKNKNSTFGKACAKMIEKAAALKDDKYMTEAEERIRCSISTAANLYKMKTDVGEIIDGVIQKYTCPPSPDPQKDTKENWKTILGASLGAQI